MLDIVIRTDKYPGLIKIGARANMTPSEFKNNFDDDKRNTLLEAITIYDKNAIEIECNDLQMCLSIQANKELIPMFRDKVGIEKKSDGTYLTYLPFEIWMPRAEFTNDVVFVAKSFKLEKFVEDNPEFSLVRLKSIVANKQNTEENAR